MDSKGELKADLDDLGSRMQCAGCGRRPEQIETYLMPAAVEFAGEYEVEDPLLLWDSNNKVAGHWAVASTEERTAAIRRYAVLTEPTLNEATGAFACDTCYLIAGMPLSKGETEWHPPTGHEWPVDKELFLEFANSKRMEVPTA